MKNSKRIIDGLLKLTLSIALLICCIDLSAQDNFYYYKGEKIQLELNPEYIFISGVDKNHIINTKTNNIYIDIKNTTEIKEDHTSQQLIQPKRVFS